MLEGDGSGADMKPSCCVCSMVGDLCATVAEVLLEDIDTRLLELWKTDEVGEVGADCGAA